MAAKTIVAYRQLRLIRWLTTRRSRQARPAAKGAPDDKIPRIINEIPHFIDRDDIARII